MKTLARFTFLVALASLPLASHKASARERNQPQKAAGAASLARLPVDFIENRGQWDSAAKFVAKKGPWAAGFEKSAIVLKVGAKEATANVRLVFGGGSEKAELSGEAKREGVFNFFIGNDPAKWQSGVAAFGSVLYRGIYEGVDVRACEERGQLEYDLILAPGADLAKVIVRCEGASSEVAADGTLVLHAGESSLRQKAPKTWEVRADGTKRPVDCRFKKIDSERYGFEVPARDRASRWSSIRGSSGPRFSAARRMKR